MVILAFIFGDERTNYADSSLYFLRVLWSESFNIEHARWGAAIWQFPALISIYAGTSALTTAICFSIGIAIGPWIIFTLLWHFLKLPQLALWGALFSYCGIATSFFNPVSELIPGLLFWLLALGWVTSEKISSRPIAWGLSIVTVAAAVSCHLLVYLMILYSLLWISIVHKTWLKPTLILAGIATLTLILFRLVQGTDSYEGGFFQVLLHPIEHQDKWQGFYPWIYFIHRIGFIYLSLLLMTVFALIILIKKASKKSILLFALGILGYALFVTLVFGEGDSDIMMERAFVPFAFISGSIVLLLFYEKNIIPSWMNLFIPFFLFLSIPPILKSGKFYTQRLEYIKSLNQQALEQKKPWAWVHLDSLNLPLLEVTWGIGSETLAAGLKHKQLATTYAIRKDELNIPIEGNSTFYYCAPFYREVPRVELPKKYLPPLQIPYQKLNISHGTY